MFDHEALISNPEFAKQYPDIFKGLADMNTATKALDKDKQLTELVKIRASQLNGCAYCVQVHIKVGKQVGLEQGKIDLIAVWRDSPHFSEREKAALALCEDLTQITPNFPKMDVMHETRKHFSKEELIVLISAIANINAWNRLGVGLGFSPTI
jgi:AhpD family alkylhydroperoxidase